MGTNPQEDFLLDPNLSSFFQYLAFLVPSTSSLISYKENIIFPTSLALKLGLIPQKLL